MFLQRNENSIKAERESVLELYNVSKGLINIRGKIMQALYLEKDLNYW